MVAARCRLDHGGGTVGGEAGEEHRGLELGARHRQLVLDGTQRVAAADPQRGGARRRGLDLGAHELERYRHPAHRPAAQGLVAVEGRLERVPGEHPAEQPHRGSGVPAVEHPGGLGQ